MQVVDLALGQLREAPWNSNQMDDVMLAKLKVNMERHGLLSPMVVRPAGDLFEVLSGNQRLRALRDRSGLNTIPCVIVKLDDPQAMLLAQTLNHLHGEEDPGLRAELLRQVLAALPEADVLAVLPETAESLHALASLGQEDLAAHLQAWQQAQGARLKHLQFQLTPAQLEVVEEALAQVLPLAKAARTSNPNVRGEALFHLCRSFLEERGRIG